MQIRGIMAATTSFWEYSHGPFFDWVCPSNYGPFAQGFCSSHYGPLEEWRHEPRFLPLKFLVLKDEFFSRKIGELSTELVWLRWFHFDRECLPSYLSLGNLRVLELYQVKRIETLWENNRNPPLQLRELIIQWTEMSHRVTFQSFPKSIGSLKLLKKLVIDCRSWEQSSFSSLPDEFCELESLEHLELKGFKMLLSLPSRFGNLRKLRHVTLQNLKSLTCLPVSFKQLTCLQYLDLSYCSSLNFTSDNLDILENITKLEYFDFRQCPELEALPNFTNQPLRKLDIWNCNKLISLPTSFDKLSYLTTLDISWCSRLECLPPSFGNLSSLTTLDITDCSSLKCLPHSFGNLSSLTTLQISSCPGLECLPPSFVNLSSLTTLHITDCSSLKCLPHSFGNLSNLTTLYINLCPRLESFPDTLGLLNLLEKLGMGPLGVKSLPGSFGQLANLRELSISDCRLRSGFASSFCSLKKLFLESTLDPTISISEDCVSLETLTIYKSSELMEIETLPKTLKRLEVKKCPRLEKLPCFAYFTSLKDLVIDGTNKIEKIENLEQMASLEKLTVTNGLKLPRLAGLEQIQRRLRRVELSTDNISALVACIQTIKRWPSEIIIGGRVVDGAESIVTDYTFPHLTVVQSVANKDISRYTWTSNCPKRCSSNSVIICVLFNCLYEECELYIKEESVIFWGISKGKWIWVGVFDSSNIIKEYSIAVNSIAVNSHEGEEGCVKMEKAIIAVGEESRVQEAFKELMLTVTRPT